MLVRTSRFRQSWGSRRNSGGSRGETRLERAPRGGGSGSDAAGALAVDAQGNAYITGSTTSNDFPVTSGFGGPVPAGTAAPYAVKLNPAGSVVYATLFAGAVNALVGFNELAIELPPSTESGLLEVSLAVAIDGILAGPFLVDNVAYGIEVIVWMEQ